MHNDWLTNVVLAAGKPYQEPTDVGFDLNPINAVKKVGKAIGRTVRKASKTVRGTLEKIPVAGPTLSAAWSLNPVGSAALVVGTAGKIAEGERIDKAAYGALKSRVKDVKTVLPLASALIGMPSVGAGAEGAIAAGNAISKTMPLGKPALDAVRSELGKNSEALAAFDISMAMFEGRPTSDNAAIKKAVGIAGETLKGKSGAAFDAALAPLNSNQKRGVKSAVAFYTAQKVQQGTRTGVKDSLNIFQLLGARQKEKDPVLKLAHQELRFKPESQKGFSTALGLLMHKANPTAVVAARDALTPEQRKGFDMGASIRVGQLSAPLGPDTTPREKLGYYLTRGTEGLKPEARKQIIQSVRDPVMVRGVRKGLNEENKSILDKVIEFIFGKTAIDKAA
jgi:hypothetical protein